MSELMPVARLGDLISHRAQFFQIDDLKEYKRCRVQLHARGIVLRDIVLGSHIKTKKQQACRPGDLLVAEIDAKLGGYGIVPTQLDQAIVSSHYFLYEVDQTRLCLEWLSYYLRTPEFAGQIRAQGSTNYAAIRPKHVLEYTIPLPSLYDQRRIVANLSTLQAKVDEVKRLQAESAQELAALMPSILSRAFRGEL